MKNFLRVTIVSIIVVPIIILGCSDLGDGKSPTTPSPSDSVKWNDVSDILDESCSVCHGADNSSEYFDVTSYNSVLNHTTNASNALVVPGDAEASELVWRLEGSNGMSLMPQGGPSFTETEINSIKKWIDDGAVQ